MKMLELPHQTADYLCPINGLCDIYEWKTGSRIPDRLLHSSRLGFQLISQKRAMPPKMIFWGHGSIGKNQLNYWKDIIGYSIFSNEGKSFRTTLEEIKQLIDQSIPTILFGLDMYHLPYHSNFYHSRHIPGHVVLMVGYDDKAVYVHDNSKDGVQTIPLGDLQLAWAHDYIGISKKNAYFGIDLSHPNFDISNILKQGIEQNADLYLNSPLSFIGKRVLTKFMGEFPKWRSNFCNDVLQKIYLHNIEFSGSILPELPKELNADSAGINSTYQASRDMFAAALLKYQKDFGTSAWSAAANEFLKSGLVIETIANGFIEDIHANSFSETVKYIPLFEAVRDIEENAFRLLLQ